MRLHSLAFSSLVLVLGGSVPAHAEGPSKAAKALEAKAREAKAKEAKAHVEAGTRYYSVQQYEKAAEEYQQAYLLDPKPAYLYASAQSQRLGGDCATALRSYDAYLRTNPAEAEQVKAKANIDRCEQDLRDRAPPVAEISPPIPVAVPEPPPAPLPEVIQPPPPPPPEQPSNLPGHFLVGSGVAVAAVGVVLFVRGRGAIQDHNSSATYDEFAATRDDLDSAKLQQTLGVSAIAVGGALIVGGIAFYAVRSSGRSSNVSASITPGSASVFVTGAF